MMGAGRSLSVLICIGGLARMAGQGAPADAAVIPETLGAVDTQVVTVTPVTYVNLHHGSFTTTAQKVSVFAQFRRVGDSILTAAAEWS